MFEFSSTLRDGFAFKQHISMAQWLTKVGISDVTQIPWYKM